MATENFDRTLCHLQLQTTLNPKPWSCYDDSKEHIEFCFHISQVAICWEQEKVIKQQREILFTAVFLPKPSARLKIYHFIEERIFIHKRFVMQLQNSGSILIPEPKLQLSAVQTHAIC